MSGTIPQSGATASDFLRQKFGEPSGTRYVLAMEELKQGDHIEVTDALGRVFEKRALSGVEANGKFPVVWACSVAEWEAAAREDREPEPEPFPWPVRSVRALEVA